MTTSESGLILPPGMTLPEKLAPQEATEVPADQRAKYVPAPRGWKVLCMVPDVQETFEGSSIVKADTVIKNEEYATSTLFVVAMGDLAYSDKEKFPTGAWCKPGDFIIARTYSGTRFRVFGKEFRILNDDQIECVVEDPRGLARV